MNIIEKLVAYLKETRIELKHVNWPRREKATRDTLLVIGISIGVAVFLGFFDMIFSYILNNFVL